MPPDRISSARFRELLAFAGLSQSKAARVLGVALRSLQHWVAGEREVSPTAERVLRLYGALRQRGWSHEEIEKALNEGP